MEINRSMNHHLHLFISKHGPFLNACSSCCGIGVGSYDICEGMSV